MYKGACKVCEQDGQTATYYGESGRNAYYRINQHADDICKENTKNAFAKNIANKHPEHAGEVDMFKFEVISTYRSCLDRQVQEGVRITDDKSDELLNSKNEYHQPSVTRVTTTREVNTMRSQGSR